MNQLATQFLIRYTIVQLATAHCREPWRLLLCAQMAAMLEWLPWFGPLTELAWVVWLALALTLAIRLRFRRECAMHAADYVLLAVWVYARTYLATFDGL